MRVTLLLSITAVKMKIIKLAVIPLTLLAFHTYGQTTYKVGDTLNVVALGGINLRNGPGTDFEKVGKLNNGDNAIISKVSNTQDSIEFPGYWVEITSIDLSKKGYAFDAFLSKYPVINGLIVDGEVQVRNVGSDLPGILKGYSKLAFQSNGCSIKYSINPYSKSGHELTINSFIEDARYIHHQYYEGYSSELELFNSRPSEAYYLIRNITKQLSPNDLEENLPYYIKKYTTTCHAKSKYGSCLIFLERKESNLISVTFRNILE